jgi:hypothetical protein
MIEETLPAHLARFLESHSSPGVIIVSQDLDIGAAIEDLLTIGLPRTPPNGAINSVLCHCSRERV